MTKSEYVNSFGVCELPGFDVTYYLSHYPEVTDLGMDPAQDFVEVGWKDFRNPSANFDVKEYLHNNPDVASARINPLIHFLDYGLIEGRQCGQPDANIMELQQLIETRAILLDKIQASHASKFS